MDLHLRMFLVKFDLEKLSGIMFGLQDLKTISAE